jgi:alkanesulfonate monooxygenase SsuD/methylene tetrahydromethanopterin reductase-like flavin-dependent oxidoreductase (luciferase family)
MSSIDTPKPRSGLTLTAGSNDATQKWIAERGDKWVVSGQPRHGEMVAYETTAVGAGHLAASMLERGFFKVLIHPPTS